jgi:hypothetical protein
MTFKEGDIVRLIREDNSGEAMRVLESNDFGNVTFCATGNDDGEAHYDTDDLELYTEPKSKVFPSLTTEQKIEGELSSIAYSVDRIRDFLRGM